MSQLLLSIAGPDLDSWPALWEAKNEIRGFDLCKLEHERHKKLELTSRVQALEKERTHPTVPQEMKAKLSMETAMVASIRKQLEEVKEQAKSREAAIGKWRREWRIP